MTPLEQLARSRVDGVGAQQYGRYHKGKRGHARLCREIREELADAYAYGVIFGRVERPYNEHERRELIRGLEAAWRAVAAMEAAREIEAPGHPEAGDPPDRALVLPDPAAHGPPAFGGG